MAPKLAKKHASDFFKLCDKGSHVFVLTHLEGHNARSFLESETKIGHFRTMSIK